MLISVDQCLRVTVEKHGEGNKRVGFHIHEICINTSLIVGNCCSILTSCLEEKCVLQGLIIGYALHTRREVPVARVNCRVCIAYYANLAQSESCLS